MTMLFPTQIYSCCAYRCPYLPCSCPSRPRAVKVRLFGSPHGITHDESTSRDRHCGRQALETFGPSAPVVSNDDAQYSFRGWHLNGKGPPMDAYLRDIGIEMQTYRCNGSPVRPHRRDAFLHDVLVAYIKKVSRLEPTGQSSM